MAALLILCLLLLEVGFVDCAVSDDFSIIRDDIYTLRVKLRQERKKRKSMETRLEVLEEQMQKVRPENGGDGNRGETCETVIRDMNLERSKRIEMEEVVSILKADIDTLKRMPSGELMPEHTREVYAMLSISMSKEKKMSREFRSYMTNMSLEMTALRSHLQTLNVSVHNYTKETTVNSCNQCGTSTNLTSKYQ